MVKHKDFVGAGTNDANKSNTAKSHTDKDLASLQENQPLNMKVLLGYLNQSEWLYLLNIGNIM